MASNKVVTYIDIGLNSVEEYWDALIVPSVKEFLAVASPTTVFHASQSVWHLHDWVWHDRYPGQNSQGTAFDGYRNGLISNCPELGWLRDFADAGKHRGLGRLPIVQGAEPQTISSGVGTMGSGGIAARVYFLVLSDGSKQEVAAVLRTATDFWATELSGKKLAPPFR